MNILGITRCVAFSPNMQDKDLEIMKAVKMMLENNGHFVKLMDEDSFAELNVNNVAENYQFVFTMMRSKRALNALNKLQKAGVMAINPYEGINNAKRKLITRIMSDVEAPVPDTIYDVDEDSIDNLDFPCWIKFADGWAKEHDDVVFVENRDVAYENLRRLKHKYPNASLVASAHLKGDLLKFYGVQGTDFFFCCYPDIEKSKFGLERINGYQQHFQFKMNDLNNICDIIADKSKIYVYGGDCIIQPNGDFHIIDFNDWPSFSACRQQAAQAIAHRIEKHLSNN